MIRKVHELIIRNIGYGFDSRVFVHPRDRQRCRVSKTDPDSGERRELLDFGNCSYLALDSSEQVIEGGVELVRKYGTTYTSSRLFSEFQPLLDAEALLSRIFCGGHCVVGTSTSLHHIGIIPAITCSDDLLCYDRAVHASVQDGLRHAETWNTRSKLLRHNDTDRLERILQTQSQRHRKIWYFCDGIYSMDSDALPIQRLRELQERYPKLWLYVDDSHGVGWYGKRGEGYFLSHYERFPQRCVVVNALSKGFGAGASAALFPDAEMLRRLRMTANHLIFSTPPQVAVVGQIIAAAKLHLSPGLLALQARLRANVYRVINLAARHRLTVIDKSLTPIVSILVGPAELAMDCTIAAEEAGLLLNPGIFPAVAYGRSIMRLTINVNHSPEDLERAIDFIASFLQRRRAQKPARQSLRPVKDLPAARQQGLRPSRILQRDGLSVVECDSIAQVDRGLWDRTMGRSTLLGYDFTRICERVFGAQQDPRSHWDMRYLFALSPAGEVLAATVTTQALVKDDMLSHPAVSSVAEHMRGLRPGFLTSKALVVGTMLSEGNHLHLRDRSPQALAGLSLLLATLRKRFYASDCNLLLVRDFYDDEHGELIGYLRSQGFIAAPGPQSATFEIRWPSFDSYLTNLKAKTRYAVRKALRKSDFIETRRARSDLQGFYGLYLQLARRSHLVSLFPYPEDIFQALFQDMPAGQYLHLDWIDTRSGEKVGSGGVVVKDRVLFPLLAGFDASYNRHHLYRRMLTDLVRHGIDGGFQRIHLGFGGIDVKSSLGATCHGTRIMSLIKNPEPVRQIAKLEQMLDVRTEHEGEYQHRVWKSDAP